MICLFVAASGIANADEPFRNHRYSSMQATPVTKSDIVFVGNSITNMHPWAEAFNSKNVVGRGNSGAVSKEVLQNIQSLITGRPAKLFLMIGTNDIGTKGTTNEEILENTRQIINHIQRESPKTEIYLQSVMPSSNGIRSVERIREYNLMLKALADEKGIHFIDHQQALMGVSEFDLSFDKLHPHFYGNRIWCEVLAPYIGKNVKSNYPDGDMLLYAGMKNSHGARLSTMSQLPIRKRNIVFLGDDLIHNTEWHEMLHNRQILNRGTGWGCWTALDVTLRSVKDVFRGRPDNECPRQVVLHTGRMELASSQASLDEVKSKYQQVIDSIKTYAPGARLTLLAVVPYGAADINQRNLVPFNDWLKQIAADDADIDFVDIYSPLVDSSDKPLAIYATGNYIMGPGLLKIARTLAPFVKGSRVADDAEREYVVLEARKQLSNAIDRIEFALKKKVDYADELRSLADEGYALLADAKSDIAVLNSQTAKINAVLPALP